MLKWAMALRSESGLDALDWKLLGLLQQDARHSYSALGRLIGMSPPAVAERVRRLEALGVITGYHAFVDPARVGLPVHALIRISGVAETAPQVSAGIAAIEEVLECHRVTGEDSYVLRVVATSIAHLEQIVDQLLPYGHVTTSLILSSPVQRRDLREP
jgi:Lrp/AsnC family leucine-responsive transcriptional regulator